MNSVAPSFARLSAVPARLLPSDGPLGSPGTQVEVVSDVTEARGERLVRVTTLRLVTPAHSFAPIAPPASRDAPAPCALVPREGGIAQILGATCWGDLRVTVVNGHTLRIGHRKTAIRRTYRDLGLYAKSSREPTRKWKLLLAICEGHGTFRWSTLGGFGAARQAVSVLRMKLKEAFGLEEDPFYEWNGGWKVRFFASSEIGSDE